MKNKNAFTLMELLVVVMLISILSAIALPQYNKVVERSRFAKAQVMAKSLYESCERYLTTWGVEDLSGFSVEDKKISKFDIGDTNLLPTGFTLDSETNNIIYGAGFEIRRVPGSADCTVRIIKGSAIIDYNGTAFACSGDDDICEMYSLD